MLVSKKAAWNFINVIRHITVLGYLRQILVFQLTIKGTL